MAFTSQSGWVGINAGMVLRKADLVSAENDGDGLANTHDIPVPVGHVLVGHARSDVEHDDGTVALNVIACAKEEANPQTG